MKKQFFCQHGVVVLLVLVVVAHVCGVGAGGGGDPPIVGGGGPSMFGRAAGVVLVPPIHHFRDCIRITSLTIPLSFCVWGLEGVGWIGEITEGGRRDGVVLCRRQSDASQSSCITRHKSSWMRRGRLSRTWGLWRRTLGHGRWIHLSVFIVVVVMCWCISVGHGAVGSAMMCQW